MGKDKVVKCHSIKYTFVLSRTYFSSLMLALIVMASHFGFYDISNQLKIPREDVYKGFG